MKKIESYVFWMITITDLKENPLNARQHSFSCGMSTNIAQHDDGKVGEGYADQEGAVLGHPQSLR